MRTMKIAFLASTFLPAIGGAEVVMHNLAIHLRKMGHEVHIITWWGNWSKVRGQLPYPVHPLLPRSHTEGDKNQLNGNGAVKPWVSRQVLWYQRRFSFDFIQIHNAYPFGPLCAQALARAGLPVGMLCTGGDLLYDPSLRYGLRCNPVLGRVLVESILACRQVVATSHLMENEYRAAGVPPEKITRIPNGVDVAGIARVADPGLALRKAHGIPADAPLLLTVGRNVVAKGYQYIPNVLRVLQDRGLDPWWVVIGAETECLGDLAVREGVRSRLLTLQTIGGTDSSDWRKRLVDLPSAELVRWYKTADLYVHPGILEAFGNIVVEAMAAGVPLVVTEGTGASDCVRKARCGLVAKTGDVEDMASNIQRLLVDAALRQEMGGRAKEGAAEYDWPLIAGKYAAAYETAIRRDHVH